jgi:hypothetical protein
MSTTRRRRKASTHKTRSRKGMSGLGSIEGAKGDVKKSLGQTAINMVAGIAGGVLGAMLGEKSMVVSLPMMVGGIYYDVAPLAFAGTGIAIGGWVKPDTAQTAEVNLKKSENNGSELSIDVQKTKAGHAINNSVNALKGQFYISTIEKILMPKKEDDFT